MNSLSETLDSRPAQPGMMLNVSLLIELLRSRPLLVLWAAILGQVLLWTIVPALLYGAPPGDVPLLLAVGHQWRLGSPTGPPLADWLAALAFDLAGQHAFGVYLLSQVCVAVTFWAVFTLGRSILGMHHAVMAALLTTGVAAFSVLDAEFGPQVLAAPLTAIALLHYWRAAGADRRNYWLALGVDLGLLVLTTYAGLILIALMALFTACTQRGRAAFATLKPWLTGIIALVLLFPHLIWIDRSGQTSPQGFTAFMETLIAAPRLLDWLRIVGWILAYHAGFFVLLGLAGGVMLDRREPAPAFERTPVDPYARSFVFFFALAPGLASSVVSVLLGKTTPVGGILPLVVLSGPAAIIVAGDVIRLRRQRPLGYAYATLLLIPPVVMIAAIVLPPWALAVGPGVDRPAAAMGQFFTDTFRRRTGQPLAFVVGEAGLAPLIAMGSPDRPDLYLTDAPGLMVEAGEAEIRQKGAIVVWPITDNRGAPPAGVKSQFPDLVPEVPRAFERPVQGRLPLFHVGWAVIRPQAQDAAPAQPPQ